MKAKWQFVHFEGERWRLFEVIGVGHLLETTSAITLDRIHRSTDRLVELLGADLTDIVPAYESIMVWTSLSTPAFINLLTYATEAKKEIDLMTTTSSIEIPVCYEVGEDLHHVAQYSGCSVEQVIEMHLAAEYRVAFLGFIPGFVYMEGLPTALHCPRRATPRPRIEAGSVGIGGDQAGIYALQSPGGWQIIGRTPYPLFDPTQTPPTPLRAGMRVRWVRISLDQLSTWTLS